MREKTGLQRQIREIFGDSDDPAKPQSASPQESAWDKPAPRPSHPKAGEGGGIGAARPVEAGPQRFAQAAPSREASNGAGSVQPIKQRYRSAGKVKSQPKTKDRVKVFIALSLAGMLIFQLIRTNFPSASNSVPTNTDPGTPLQASIVKPPNIVWPVPGLYPKDIRDPMEWITQDKTMVNGQVRVSSYEPTSPIVRGILYSDDKPRAIIGTQLVRAGDIVYGAMIMAINRKTVEFEMDGQRWTQEVEEVGGVREQQSVAPEESN